MSSSSRTTSKGGKGAKADSKSHKSDSGKGSVDKQHRDSQTHSKNEDPLIKEKVKQLIEMSQRTEEEVCLALYECDYDVNLASNMLFETMATGEWEMTVKKKKNRQTSASKQDKAEDGTAGEDDWNDGAAQATGGGGDKERGRNKSGGPNRLNGRHNDGRGWKGRERQENERNLEDGGGRGEYGRGDRRGRSGGAPRGSGGRGRGGGRAGGRFPSRNSRGGGGSGGGSYNKPIDTWDNTWEGGTGDSGQAMAAINHNADDNWEDVPGPDEWTTEEYTGSLADTKVFTPSSLPLSEEADQVAAPNQQPIDLGQSLAIGQQGAVQVPSQSPVPPMVGTLTAAQSQYFSQLSQQNNEGKPYGAAQTYQDTFEKVANAPQVYNNASQYNTTQQTFASQVANSYNNNAYQAVNSNYTPTQEQPPAQQPTRTKTQRARVPPPSKIPSSAVEMPGELNNIGYLDVQFGAMDLMDNNSFDSVGEMKYSGSNSSNLDSSLSSTTNNLDLNSSTNQSSNLDAYSTKTNIQSSISTALSQSLSNTDSIPQTSDHLTSTYNSTARTSQTGSAAAPTAATPAGLDALSKSTDGHSYPQASTYNSYQPKAGGYNSSYSTAQTTASSYVSNQANSYVNSQPASYNTPSSNSYPNSYSSTTAYQSNANSFPSISQAGSSYQSTNQTYPQNASQSAYGANSGLGSTSNFGSTTTSQYNNYNSSANHKIGKDSSYDNSSSAVSSSQTTSTTNAASTSTTLPLSQTTISSSKTTTTLGVAPVMSTPYIMGQVPYFQQPIYSYEEMQLLQQRLPHMTTPYYDVSYQTPTTLAAVRDASVGYSLSSDGRGGYTAAGRGGDTASPAPNAAAGAGGAAQAPTAVGALAAQQGHQHQQAVAAAAQPILAAGTAPPFFYAATAFNTIAPNYAQFGTMYTQLPAAANAHGSNSSTQYPKPGTYGSGYGSYDALNQTQDYSKSGYVASTQSQKGTGGNASSTGTAGSDLSAMYSKSHTALGKVNSYEKQGFHSGTPPPFTGALHGSQGAGLAPSGTGYAPQVYIPTMAPHSTQLMHQPLHQMDVRHQGRRVDSGNTTGQRSQGSNQNKSGAKQAYQASYWNQN